MAATEKAANRCLNPYTWPTIQLALYTAMRRSELLQLHWLDIDLEAQLATLHETKNGHAQTIPLTRDAIKVLATLPRQGQSVLPMTELALRQSWERLVKRAGVNGFRFHDFRHEAISRFFEMGLSVPEVALISSHRDARMLFRYTAFEGGECGDEIRKMRLTNKF